MGDVSPFATSPQAPLNAMTSALSAQRELISILLKLGPDAARKRTKRAVPTSTSAQRSIKIRMTRDIVIWSVCAGTDREATASLDLKAQCVARYWTTKIKPSPIAITAKMVLSTSGLT